MRFNIHGWKVGHGAARVLRLSRTDRLVALGGISDFCLILFFLLRSLALLLLYATDCLLLHCPVNVLMQP